MPKVPSPNKLPPKCNPLCKKKSSKCEALVPYQTDETLRVSLSLKKPPQIVDMNGNDTYLDVNNSHLRVTSGNVHASGFNLDQITIVTTSNTGSTINFLNDTKGFTSRSNIEVGTANLFVDTTTSNVGVGTNEPAYTLDVHGSANVGVLTVSNVAVDGTLVLHGIEVSGGAGSTLESVTTDLADNSSRIGTVITDLASVLARLDALENP